MLGERFEKVPYYIDIAEWLLSKQFPTNRASAFLQAAVDTLLDAEAGDDDGAPEGEEGRSQTGAGGSQFSGKASSARRPSATSGSAMGRRTSAVSASQRSVKSGRPGSAHSRAGSAKARSAAGSSRHVLTSSDGYPVRLLIEHYDMLIRALTMQAQLANRFEDRQEKCTQAVFYVQALAVMTLQAANSSVRTNAYSKLTKEEQATCNPDTMTLDPTRLFPVPDSLVSLANLDLSTTLLTVLRRASSESSIRSRVPGPNTLRKAPVTFYHLTWLSNCLVDYGLHIHAGAVLSLTHLVSELVPGPSVCPFLPLLARLRRARVLTTLGQTERAKELLHTGNVAAGAEGTGPGLLGIEASTVQQFLGVVAERERQLASKAAGLPPDDGSMASASSSVVVDPDQDLIIKGFEMRHIWAFLAEEAAILNQARAAREYLDAAARHNRAYQDAKNSAYCARVKAQLEAGQGRGPMAISYLLLSLDELKHTGDATEWGRTSTQVADLLSFQGDWVRAEKVLREARNALLAKVEIERGSSASLSDPQQQPPTPTSPPGNDVNLDAALAWGRVSLRLADLLGQRILSGIRTTASLAAATSLAEVYDLYGDVERRLANVGLHPTAVDLVLQQARFSREAAKTIAWAQARELGIDDLLAIRFQYAKAARMLNDLQATATLPRTCVGKAPSSKPPSLPSALTLAEVQAEAAQLEGYLARLKKEHASKAMVERERAAANPAVRWLMDNVVPVEQNVETIKVGHSEEAALRGAVGLGLTSSPAATAASAGALGNGLLLLALREGRLDGNWDGPNRSSRGTTGNSRMSMRGSVVAPAAGLRSPSIASPVHIPIMAMDDGTASHKPSHSSASTSSHGSVFMESMRKLPGEECDRLDLLGQSESRLLMAIEEVRKP